MPRGEYCDPLPQRPTTFLGSQRQRDKGNRKVSKNQRGKAPSPWSKCLSMKGFQERPGAEGGPMLGLGRKEPSRKEACSTATS